MITSGARDTLFYYLKTLIIALSVAILFWLAETLIHTAAFNSGSFFNDLYPHDSNELWMRGLIAALLLGITFITAFFLRQKFNLSMEIKLASVAFDTMREGAVITNKRNQIIYINSRYTEISGYQPEEVLGKNPNVLSSGKQDRQFYAVLWKSLLDIGFWEGEIWNRKKSGELYPEWISITAIKNKRKEVCCFAAIFSDITSRKQTEELMAHYAFYDPLTDLPNRRFFNERLAQALRLAKRAKQQLAILFLDLDHFKPINDQYGHLVGDQFLCAIAGLLRSTLRDSDTLSRFGGDEFVILLPNIESKTSAFKVAKSLLASFKMTSFEISGHQLSPEASIGIATYPDDALEVESLIQFADKAMYQMKKGP